VTALVVVVGAIVVPAAGRGSHDPGAAGPTTYANPAIDDATADPFVFTWGQRSYAYVDGGDRPSHQNVPAYVSDDLATWDAVGDVLPDDGLASWRRTGPGDAVGSPALASFPDSSADARFVLYFTATDARSGHRCIGVATAGAPTGPFRSADAPLLCPPGGARDPSPVAGSGAGGAAIAPAQLVFRQDGPQAGLYGQQLGSDGLSVALSPSTPLRLDDAGGPATRPAVLPVAGDRAVLLFSSPAAGPAAAARSIGWTRCPLTGSAEAPVVGACSPPPGARPWIGGSDAVESPGAPQVFGGAGERWIAYDAFAPGACAPGTCTGPRRLHVDKLCVGDDGVPRTAAPSAAPLALALARQPACRDDVPAGWAATWAAGLMPASAQFAGNAQGFADQTLRQVVHTSVGGEAVRVRLSNVYGTAPLAVGRATVAVAAEPAGSSGAVRGPTLRPLTFGGTAGVVVPAGGDVVSDAVTLAVPQDHDLAVSLWFPQPTGRPSAHLVALETSYVGRGDLTADPGPGFGGAGATTTTSSFFVSAVDVVAKDPLGTVVLLGDSLTDGAGGIVDGERRWSDIVVDRLAAEGGLRLGLVNVGIAGNTLLGNPRSTSPGALERLDRDVLAQADADTVVVLLGTNDLAGSGATGPELVAGLQQLIDRSHAAGVRVVGATVPPLAGPDDPPTPAPLEQARTTVNTRIRPGPGALAFDAVVDMDAVLRDPADPTRIRARFSWFGGLHPNDAGHQAMADGVDLAVLLPPGGD
jgi:lysophospholipase L1-like esterase